MAPEIKTDGTLRKGRAAELHLTDHTKYDFGKKTKNPKHLSLQDGLSTAEHRTKPKQAILTQSQLLQEAGHQKTLKPNPEQSKRAFLTP